MDRHNLDLAVISDQNNLYYFTGLLTYQPILSYVLSLSFPTYLFAFRDDEPLLLTSHRNSQTAERNFGGEVATYVSYDLNERMLAYPGFVAGEAKKILSRRNQNLRKVGIESWTIPQVLLQVVAGEATDIEFFDLSELIQKMRTVKDPDELEAIKMSCELNDFAYSIAKPASVPGRSEIEVYALIQEELVRKMGSYQFFAGDFVSGERSLSMGGPPTPRVLKEGETFILDLWLTAEGYWSDTSRTFVVGGHPTSGHKRVLELLKQAMVAGQGQLRPGTRARDVYRAVFNVIDGAGYGRYFPHHAGHAIGLDDQEPPFLIPGCDDELKKGMVCTLEPGIYLPEVGGIRIENNYIIRDGEAERLTNYPLDL